MSLPLSIKTQLEKCVKRAERLKGQTNGKLTTSEKADAEIELGELFTSLALAMDKIMNRIWEDYSVRPATEKNKPNIYFPQKQNENSFIADIEGKYQLGVLKNDFPNLLELIKSIQEFEVGPDHWWPRLQRIAKIRHERFPEISQAERNAIGFGRGQNLYIKEMTMRNGVVNFDGHAWNQKTGSLEPVNVDYISEIKATIEGIEIDPFELCATCAQETHAFAKRVGLHFKGD